MIKDLLITKLVTKRYDNFTPAQISQYFIKLSPVDQALITEEILNGRTSLAKDKIILFMKEELAKDFTQYYTSGAIPTTIVEELFS